MPQRPNQSTPKWFVSLNTNAQNQIKKKFTLLVIILKQEHSYGTSQHQQIQDKLCASFKIKIEFEGWVNIVDELKRLKRVNIHIKNKNKIHQNGYTLTHHQKKTYRLIAAHTCVCLHLCFPIRMFFYCVYLHVTYTLK